MSRALLLVLALLAAATLAAPALAEEPPVFATVEQEERFQRLTRELRCPKCQNQTLNDSNAPLAIDLRRQIATMVQDGYSDEEVKTYLVARYSDFVLYRPPVQGNTALLWTAPFLLLGAGAAALIIAVRRRARGAEEPADPSAVDESLADESP